MRLIPLVVASFAFAAAAWGNEFSIALKPGPGAEVVANNCAACHSLDYVVLNSPFPTRAVWQTEVAKMIKVYGADISDDDARAIVEYLAKNYGS
ncbi:MAG TPA: cytochrome c [Roseiarcus sp.]|nr:cytochrome c [Roseiarcus sp.]